MTDDWRSYRWLDLLAYVDRTRQADHYSLPGPDEDVGFVEGTGLSDDGRLSGFSTEMTDSVRSLLYAIGLRFTDTTVDVRPDGRQTVDILKACGMVADAVTSSYDLGGKEPDHHHYRNQWDLFGLGGDDDVDYNGGYITIIVDILLDYIQDQPPPIPPWKRREQ